MIDEELRTRAVALRRAGRTYDEIVAELGVSKSSVSLWVRDLPRPRRSPEEMRQMSEARWGPYREKAAAMRRATHLAARSEIGQLTDRELFLVGVGLYWAEGTKNKAHNRPEERVSFINSDPDMIRFFLAWLRLLKVDKERLRFTVSIHESADVAAAEHYWTEISEANPVQFGKTCLKKHNPKTVRKNVGADYRGCLTIRVLGSADLYRSIEGWWAGIVWGLA